MSFEKLGKIVETSFGGKVYRRKLPGVNFPTDFMTDEEIEKLSGEVTIYYVEVDKKDRTSAKKSKQTKKAD